MRAEFLIFGLELGAFLGHGAAGGFVAGEVGGLVFTAAVEHDLAAGAAHQVVGVAADTAFLSKRIRAGHGGGGGVEKV